MSSYPIDQCSICKNSLNSKDSDEITTACGHTFHRTCAQKRLDRYQKRDCQICRREHALGDALNKNRTTKPSATETRRPGPTSATHSDAHHSNEHNDNNWSCRKCQKSNHASSKQCQSCGVSKRDDQKHFHQESRSKKNEEQDETRERTKNNDDFRKSRPMSPPRTQRDEILYVVNLPANVKDNSDLADLVRHRVENNLQIPVRDIKCYRKLAIGVIRVADRQTKKRLVQSVQEITLNTGGRTTTIQFVDTLELTSYIVLEATKSTKDFLFPASEEISIRWMDLYRGDKPQSCEQLSRHFPNIYRVVTKSLDEILQIIDNSDFFIKKQTGRVYFCSNCSFLEDLPKITTENQIRTSICTAIEQANISSSSLFIQMNKQNNSACIIVTGEARRWMTHNSVYIDGEKISKKDDLTYHLLVHPVPSTFSIESIIHHSIFSGKILSYKQRKQNLILDLSDKHIFDVCIRCAVVKIEKFIFQMEEYVGLDNGNDMEINAETWYETEMLRYKSDIKQFLENLGQVIFHYKWNSYIWLEQFQRLKSRNDDNNRIRHLLRMTVMLNTIGTICKRSYMIHDREVKFKKDNQMKTIVYDHQSKLARGGKIPISDTPYKSTVVEVVKSDCLDVYERLVKSGRRPLLLQMTNWKHPGSEYQKNDGTQEENLFRQSDYFQSLNTDLDHHQQGRPSRYHCSSKRRLDPLSNQDNIHRIDDFGGVYTSGVTVFRRAEDTGYAYMEKPLEDVCVLTMTAYENPTLEKDMLSPKYAMATRKKIENIFSVAYHHQHNSLVLSTFACQVNKNPVDHIVQLFNSVIEQYAGFFRSITFAIPDDFDPDHNSNSKKLFQAFEKLDGTVNSIKLIRKPNTIFGPYRILSEDAQVSDIDICDLSPCQFGGKCRDGNDKAHTEKFSHPPLCSKACLTGKCDQTNNIVHMYSFLHRNQCQYGGECRQIDDEKHCQDFEHPPYCPAGGTCNITTETHLRENRHLPLCKHSHNCMDLKKGNKHHCSSFRHCALNCPHKNYCADFHDRKHFSELQHPFPPPCPFTPYHCNFHNELIQTTENHKASHDAQKHCLDYAHVCRFGRNCRDLTPLHMEKSIHVARCLCPDGDKCTKLNQEEHLNSFTHDKILDIRLLCRFSDKCHDRQKSEHIVKFRHKLYSDGSGVVRHDGLNKSIDFVRNHTESITRVNDYIESQTWEPLPSRSIPDEILNWIRTVQPVHRCNPVIFESIILHGHVMSRSYMEKLKIPRFVANSVLQHSRMRRIKDLNIKSVEQKAKDYVVALVKDEFEKHGFPNSGKPSTTIADATTHTTLTTMSSLGNEIKIKENLASSVLNADDMDALRRTAIEIAQASIKLHSNPAGIGYQVDVELGTDRTIFSVLGPHLGHYYGDIVIVFKRDILHHPDAEFSMQAGTSFASGKAYSWRPWLGVDPGSGSERIKLFHGSKMHASVPGYDYAAALELMAITSFNLAKKSMNINLQDVMERWIQVDSHQTIEAHLPQLIPLDYIDHIYLPQNIYDALNLATRKSIGAVFRHRITITPHEGEIEKPGFIFGPTPPTQPRAEYQKFIVIELIKRFMNHIENSLSRPIQGAIITIPSTSFNDHFLLPLTLSQAYRQYCVNHTKSSTDKTIFIYWQAMNGDMMLTLSNEQINLHEKQPKLSCLVCYVAEAPEPESNHYHEQTSYLNNGRPLSHDVIINNRKYASGSNTFYIGCNSGDFLTLCLELQPSTGIVTLSHAGANSIYNRAIITHTFDKSQLDLTTLEFLYVSAGTRIVPIRNVMICFEKQIDLHPTYDTHFIKSTGLVDSSTPAASLSSGSLIPCPDNINCLRQLLSNEKAHNSKYSHPCRFSELCRNPEPNLTHEPHQVTICHKDTNCKKLTDPVHRAEYRHTSLPDYLVPCRFQQGCSDKSDKHRMKYSHGEKVFGMTGTSLSDDTDESSSSDDDQKSSKRDDRIPCKWDTKCRDVGDRRHCEKYSHPSMEKQGDHRIPCKWGLKCREIHNKQHCQKYSHPQTSQSHDDDDDKVSLNESKIDSDE